MCLRACFLASAAQTVTQCVPGSTQRLLHHEARTASPEIIIFNVFFFFFSFLPRRGLFSFRLALKPVTKGLLLPCRWWRSQCCSLGASPGMSLVQWERLLWKLGLLFPPLQSLNSRDCRQSSGGLALGLQTSAPCRRLRRVLRSPPAFLEGNANSPVTPRPRSAAKALARSLRAQSARRA